MRLKFFFDEGHHRAWCKVKLPKKYQGPPKHAHGGIIATLLDEAMGKVNKLRSVVAKDKVGKVTLKQVEDIAKQKMPDLNAASVDAAIRSVRGTARSMGIEVVG